MQEVVDHHCELQKSSEIWKSKRRDDLVPTARVGLSLLKAKARSFSPHTPSR